MRPLGSLSVRLGQGGCRNLSRATDCAKQRALGIAGDAGAVEIFVQVDLEIVVARQFVMLAAFFVQADPQASVLGEDILDFHRKRRADACERIDHEANQRAISQSDVRADVDAVEEPPCFVGRGILPFFTTWRRPRTDAAGLTRTTWPTTGQSKR